MRNKPNISDAELQLMKIIWKTPNITANKIVEQLGNKMEWKPNTIKTLLNRLLNKDVIGFNKEGKEYYYYPLVDEENYISAESKSFLDKVFNGSINSMVLNFVKNKKLSDKDIEELKEIINQAHKGAERKY